MQESQKGSSAGGSRRSGSQFNQVSKHLYSFGGKSKNPLLNPVLSGSMNFEKRPNTRGGVVEYDAISKASSAYVGKHNTSKRQRHSSAQSKTLKLSQNSKTFYPDAYFKRVGYQKSDASSRVDALGQRVRDRFNEELEFEEPKARGGLHQRTLKQLKASNQKQLAGSAAAVSRKSADIWSDKRLSLAKKSLKVDNENNKFNTIEKDAGDKESVITKDRL